MRERARLAAASGGGEHGMKLSKRGSRRQQDPADSSKQYECAANTRYAAVCRLVLIGVRGRERSKIRLAAWWPILADCPPSLLMHSQIAQATREPVCLKVE